MAFELTNLPAFAASVERATARLMEQADESFVKMAEGIAEQANATAHPSAYANVTVGGQRGRRSHVLDVGPGKGDFPLVFWEFGTIKNPATPFLRPAIAEGFAAWKPWP